MSLSWDDEPASSDDAGWRTRLGAWFAPSPAELAGLAVLVVGALLLSAVLWLQATSRPMSFDTASADAVGEGALAGAGVPGNDARGGMGAHEIGARMDVTGAADGPAPGTEEDGAGAGSGTGGSDGPADAGADRGSHAEGRPPDGTKGATDTGQVVVHVTGAVRTTGLVTLAAGARIGDAVVAAGGARSDALVDRVNLARVVVDGEHVHVPAEGDDPSTLPPIGGVPWLGGSAASGPSGEGPGAAGPIRLNHATAEELETLPGIGPARAEAIITHREQQGPFAMPGDLRAVSGIGEATFQRLAPLITVE